MSIPGSNVFPGWGQGGPPARRGSSVVDRWSRLDRRRLAPARWFPARPRAGARLSLEESRRKEHQGQAPGPRVLWPLVATRWFLGPLPLIRSRGYFVRYAKTDLGRIFRKKYAEKAFLRKKGSKSGHADGHRNSLTTVPLRPTTPKRASDSERPLNPGGAGGIPPRLFASRLSLEKAWIPRPGPGGEPRRRSGPALVQTRPPCRGQPDAAYPSGGWLGRHPLGAAPRGAPPARRGSPFLPRNGEKEGRGRCPRDPGVYGPLTLVRSFWGSLSLIRSRGYYFRYPKTDLGRIFEGKYAGKHFRERKFPNRGTYMGHEIAQRPSRCAPPRQNERVGTSGP